MTAGRKVSMPNAGRRLSHNLDGFGTKNSSGPVQTDNTQNHPATEAREATELVPSENAVVSRN